MPERDDRASGQEVWVEAQGMDGRAVADETGITLHFGGVATRPVKKSASPRHLPWASIESVTFTKGGLRPGSLRVNVVGESSSAVKVEVDINALMVNVGKQTDSCRLFAEQVSERLRTRIDASQVRVDAGEQDRSVADARSRVKVKFGGRRELRKLQGHLLPGELVRYAASGRVNNRLGLIALTDRRLLVLFSGMLSQKIDEIPLDNITSTKEKKGILLASLTILASNTEMEITNLPKVDQQALVMALRSRITTGSLPPLPALVLGPEHDDGSDEDEPIPPTSPTDGPSPGDRLRELAQLHAEGVLTDDEFEAAKARILDSM